MLSDRTSPAGRAILVFLLIFSGHLFGAENGTAQVQPVVQDSTSFRDLFDDGPHVYLQTDSSAIVFYLCNGAVIQRSFDRIDTLRFRGLCHDTGMIYTMPWESPAVKPHMFNSASKIMAISDVHGEYDHLVDILVNSGVIDDEHRWAWGDGHLVVLGDVFDRGKKVTECLWLIYRLELEAERDGGWVHFILGNHELMILRGDNRYIHERYLDGIVKKTRIKHEDLYGPDMQLGRWLRSKHTIVKIGDVVFVHAGISPSVVNRGLGLDHINQMVRDNVDLRSSQLAFDKPVNFLFGGQGPFWYRGYHYEMEGRYPQASSAAVDSILAYYDGDFIVVGHTEITQVSGLYGNRVLAIDVPVDELGSLQALLWENGRFYRVTGQGELQPIE